MIGFDGASGLETWRMSDVQHDINGLAVGMDQLQDGAWMGVADLTADVTELWLSITDLETGGWVSKMCVWR